MRYLVLVCVLFALQPTKQMDAEEVSTEASPAATQFDSRDGELRTLNSYFPFQSVADVEEWERRQRHIKRRILVSQGLWPLPTKSPVNAVVHGPVNRGDYTVERVIFESIPGHYVTGSLYRPNDVSGRVPAILSPHGHWADGRFYDAGEPGAKAQIESGAETRMNAARYPLQARAVQLARMGCIVFHYDMTGNADSIQIGHRPERWQHLDTQDRWGFMSVQADLRLQNMMGLQTWNSIRAVDFLESLEEVDTSRIGVTGASGGGTQSMILSAIDERISASMPCVMVSTAMQGGCTCENAPLLRIDQGNIDIAAATAPRPLGLTAADDWTIELETKGYPDLVRVYELLGVPQNLSAVFHTQFKHNYNEVNRRAMYSFFNRHFQLGFEDPQERDFEPLTRAESTVWTESKSNPVGDQIGDRHEQRLLSIVTRDSDRSINQLIPSRPNEMDAFHRVIGGAWETILGRRLDDVGDVVFESTGESTSEGLSVTTGRLSNTSASEQVAIQIIEKKTDVAKQSTVIWLADERPKSGRETNDHRLGALVDAGHRVVVPTLFDHTIGKEADGQRMWYQRSGDTGWHRFSGYTFGFNHSLFAQRTHDLLTVIRFLDETEQVSLVGLGETYGPLALAACSQSTTVIDHCLVDLGGFEFASLDRHDHPMFVPGAVKYLDVDGLAALCWPTQLTVAGPPMPVAKRVFAVAGHGNGLRQVEEVTAKSLRNWPAGD